MKKILIIFIIIFISNLAYGQDNTYYVLKADDHYKNINFLKKSFSETYKGVFITEKNVGENIQNLYHIEMSNKKHRLTIIHKDRHIIIGFDSTSKEDENTTISSGKITVIDFIYEKTWSCFISKGVIIINKNKGTIEFKEVWIILDQSVKV